MPIIPPLFKSNETLSIALTSLLIVLVYLWQILQEMKDIEFDIQSKKILAAICQNDGNSL